MDVKLGETRRWMFGTSSATTGAATNADSTPTATVREQGTALGYSPTVTNKATGLYEVSVDCTSGNGFDVGKEYTLEIAATVGGTTGRDGIGHWFVRTNSIDDVDTVVDAIKAKTDNLPPDPADASDVAAEFAVVEAKLDAIDDYVDTEVAAIKAKTDNLPPDPADNSDILAAIAAIDPSADLTSIQSDVDTLLTNQDVLLGLLHHNSVVDKQTWSGGDLLTARIRRFPSAAAAAAATYGAADDADNEIRRFKIAVEYAAAGKPRRFMITEDVL